MTSHRAFKDRLYGQLARIGKGLGSPARLELLDLLAQGERTVEALAAESGLTVGNASQHLQVLRRSGLVESRKEGLFVHYRLSDASVFDLVRAVRSIAEERLAEVDRLVREHFADRDADPVPFDELMARVRKGDVVVLDTRPAIEYAAGHIEGALSAPVEELHKRLAKLPKSREYVAYCRGPYCIYADRAVEMLRKGGRRARRLALGFPEWKAAGLPVAVG
jgi:rhodanese-related sulfurtransferase/DNA-binding transcriptional ArsR family regulator